MTLAKADRLANFYLQQIQDEGTLNPIAERLGQELLFRLNQRRNKELSGLALYLESAGNYESVAKKSQLEYPPKNDDKRRKEKGLLTIATELYERLFSENPAEESENQQV